MYRTRMLKEEDENAMRRQAYLNSLNQKKELLMNEFEKLQDQKKFDQITVKSNNEVHFKNLLNELKRTTVKKQEKLLESEKTTGFLRAQSIQNLNEVLLKEDNGSMNASFTKSFYKNKIFESMSYKHENNPESLRKKLTEIKKEVLGTKNNIENEILNQTAIQSKLIEIENSKKKMLVQMNDLSFAKKMTFKRFNNLEALKFNAQSKKKLSLLQLSQIKYELGQIKSIESDFFKQKIGTFQQEKHELDKEQTEISRLMLQIDTARNKLSNTEKEIIEMEFQEEQLIRQKMEAFYIGEYICFFKEFESLFINEEIKKFENPKEELKIAERVCSPQNGSPSKLSEHNNAGSPLMLSPTNRTRRKQRNSESPNKKFIKREVNMGERLSVVRNIFDFHQEHPKLGELVAKIIKVYNDLIIQSNSLSTQYEEVMVLKKRKTKELELETQSFDTLKEKNTDLIYPIKNITEEQNKDKFSLNAGVLTNFYSPDELTTVNRLKQEVFPVPEITANEIEQLREQTLENEKFAISVYLSVSSKILLLADILLLVSDIGEPHTPPSLKKLCEGIKTKIIGKKSNPKNEKTIENTLLAPINDINFDKVLASFCQFFPLDDLVIMKTFYNCLKNERTMGFFLNMDIIAQYFKSISSKFKEKSEKIIEKLDELKNKAYEIQSKKTQLIFEGFIQIFEEISRFKENMTEKELQSAYTTRFLRRKNTECLSSFNLQNKKKQVEKVRATQVSFSSDEDKKENSVSLKKIDSIENLSYNKASYKPSYYFSLEDSKAKPEDDQKSESEAFEEDRNNIKNDLDSKNINEQQKKEPKKNESNLNLLQKNSYLHEMIKISENKSQIEKSEDLLKNHFLFLGVLIVEKRTNVASEPISDFHQKLKTQKEKTIYNLYHNDKGYKPKVLKEKQNHFKIKNNTLLIKSEKTNKNNQTNSTIVATSRAQTSSTNKRKRNPLFENREMILGKYFLNNGLDYDVLFNKTEEDSSGNYSAFNYQSVGLINGVHPKL